MPAHSLNLPAASRRPLAARLAAGLCAALLGPIAAAADVLVVTDSRHPVQTPAGVRVIELDQATASRSNSPRTCRPTRNRPQPWCGSGCMTAARRCSVASAMPTKVSRMPWGLGIAKIPAVVVDRRYVVYGEPEVSRAVARINAYRSTQP